MAARGHNPLKRLIFILCMLVLLGIGVAGLILWPTIVTEVNDPGLEITWTYPDWNSAN
jgi:hypothetical protein